MGQRIDVRIDPDCDLGRRAARRRDGAEPVQFGNRLDVDLVDTGIERGVKLGTCLADAGEDDLVRRDAGGERAPQFALRDDVSAGSEPGQDTQYREVRVGLDGVADQRSGRRKRRGKAAVAGLQCGSGIDVERRPDSGGDARQRHRLGIQFTAAIGEEISHSDRSWDRCSARPAAVAASPSCRSRRARRR